MIDIQTVIDKHYKLFLNHAHSILGDIDLAQDMVQEVLIDIYRHGERYSMVDNLESYCLRAISNKCYKHIGRSIAVIPLESVGEANLPATEPAYSHSTDLLQSLPPKYRRLIELHDIEGYSCTEIALRYGKTPSTIRKQIAKIHKQLNNEK